MTLLQSCNIPQYFGQSWTFTLLRERLISNSSRGHLPPADRYKSVRPSSLHQPSRVLAPRQVPVYEKLLLLLHRAGFPAFSMMERGRSAWSWNDGNGRLPRQKCIRKETSQPQERQHHGASWTPAQFEPLAP